MIRKIMFILSERQNKIIEIMLKNGRMRSSEIYSEIIKEADKISLVTVKRELSLMLKHKILSVSGLGRSVHYEVGVVGRVFFNVDDKKYLTQEPDQRYGSDRYNFTLFNQFPEEIFTKKEIEELDKHTATYKKRAKNISDMLLKKETERFIIELSWKSSKIEGNTYSLLDTEKLVLENKMAVGHNKEEAQMILNHKEAFCFILEHSLDFRSLNRGNLEKLHEILVKKLNVNRGFRKNLVGIVGSKYRPIDNAQQIKEAVDNLVFAVSKMKSPYEKALLALLGISYIQPFEDGNKRVSRFIANAIFLSYGYAPLSYRSVDENDYRNAMIIFYELNSIMPFKKIFTEQYIFSSQNYLIKA